MKPFLQGKKSLAAGALRLPPAVATARLRTCDASQPGGGAPAGASNASVEVVKEGDKVARLIVTCACGERIEIDCVYPVGA